MKIYVRHVLTGFLGLFLLIFLASVAVFIVIDFAGNSRVWLARPQAERIEYYLNYLPYIAYLVCPIALLLAAVSSVGGMAKRFEIVALRAAGVPVSRILAPILWTGLIASVIMFQVQDRVLPDANRRRFQIQEPGTGFFEGMDPRERRNYVYTASDGTLIYFQHYSGVRTLGTIVTAMRLRDGAPVLRVDARYLDWSDSTGWTFRNGSVRDFAGDSVRSEEFSEWSLPGFSDPPRDLLDERSHPDEMSLTELAKRIEVQRRTGEPDHALRTHWHFRHAGAMVNFIMAALGGLLAVNTVRAGLARNFGVGLFLTFLYYVALRLGLVMGENGGMPPAWAAWFGNLVFLPVAVLLWWRAARA